MASLGYKIRTHMRWEDVVVQRRFWKYSVLTRERKRKSSEGKYNVLTSKTAGKENIMCLSVKILFLKGRMCSLG